MPLDQRHNGCSLRGCDGPSAAQMAPGTIVIENTELAGSIAAIRAAGLDLGTLMLVFVMPEVRCLRARLVLAIARRDRPTELERHEHQQNDGQPFTHKVNSVAAIDLSSPFCKHLGN